MAWAAACVVEGAYALFSRWITTGPVITRYTVAATCRDFWFTHSAATRDFGYQPIVTADEAYSRTLDWLRDTEIERAAHPPSS